MAQRSPISRNGSIEAGEPRIVSLIPSGTEIAYALGLGAQVVGVTHACDFPAEVLNIPRVTSVDSQGVASLDVEAVLALQPEILLFQDLCGVCAIPAGALKEIRRQRRGRIKLINLSPSSIGDVLSTIKTVGDHTGRMAEARQLTVSLRSRIDKVALRAAQRAPVSTLCLKWLDPPWSTGHWGPEMIGLAGGMEVLGQACQRSRPVSWGEIARSNPAFVLIAPCGLTLNEAEGAAANFAWPPEWFTIDAVRQNRVFVMDGSAFLTRPGPRLVDGMEIIEEILSDADEREGVPWRRVSFP